MLKVSNFKEKMDNTLYNPPDYIFDIISQVKPSTDKYRKRISVPDVAIKAGVDLNSARKDLMLLAALTGNKNTF
jgi:hypothetical protein